VGALGGSITAIVIVLTCSNDVVVGVSLISMGMRQVIRVVP